MKRSAFLKRFAMAVMASGMLADALIRGRPVEEEWVVDDLWAKVQLELNEGFKHAKSEDWYLVGDEVGGVGTITGIDYENLTIMVDWK